MKPDGTDSSSTASEKHATPKGTHDTEQDKTSGSEVKKCSNVPVTTWSYLFVHHSKVQSLEQQLMLDGRTYFVHKTVRYFKNKDKHGVQQKERPTVSGLVFLQGSPKEIQIYLNERYPYLHLCKNCSTGRVAVIPESQMRPFMRINETKPERIRFLLKPFHYYARNRILLRITTGELAGLEGYVIRIDRDRRLVMNVGGISVAVSGVHAEHFEEVEQGRAGNLPGNPFYERNLQECEALIDRYFHPVKSAQDVALQVEHIEYLHRYALSELAERRMKIGEAWFTLSFIIKEIGYYYAPIIEQSTEQLAPIMNAGSKIFRELGNILDNALIDRASRELYQAEYQELTLKYGYLF